MNHFANMAIKQEKERKSFKSALCEITLKLLNVTTLKVCFQCCDADEYLYLVFYVFY